MYTEEITFLMIATRLWFCNKI